MKENRAFLKPYIRLAKPNDFNSKKATSFSTIVQMGKYKRLSKCYVLVQRGSNKIVTMGKTKDEIKKRAPLLNKGRGINKRFNKWKNAMKHYAQYN